MTNSSEKAEAFAENVWTKLLARGSMVLAAVLVSVLGWAGRNMLAEINGKLTDLGAQAQVITNGLAAGREADIELRGQIRLLDQKNVEQDRRLDSHDNRLESLSRRANVIP